MDHSREIHSHHTVLIIGAGFSGLGLGIRLRQTGEEDFVILDQAADVGGTWWVNRYPGCACDVQSHLYSLSFAPKPDWPRHFGARVEIQAYLSDCVDRFALAGHLRLNTRVVQAHWDEVRKRWLVTEQNGVVRSAKFLVTATGGLSRPAWPDISGLDGFAGNVFHSQQWPENLNLDGKRVAVIGSGASAIQFVPRIQSSVAQLDFYQRTPQWILPKPDRSISPRRRKLYQRFPIIRRLFRLALFVSLESRLPAFTRFQFLTWFHRRQARNFLKQHIHDPALRHKLTPTYDMGCKRVLMSNDFYPAIDQPNLELITARIARITPNAIVDENGQSRTIDTIILATGFLATRPVPSGMIRGRDERDLARHWKDGPSAFKGTTVHGFPNMFMLLGPNTALGHNSVLLMIESQINYVLDALAWCRRSGRETLEVSDQAEKDWNQTLQKRLSKTVWNRGGCSSWYRHPVSGRNTTLWPRFTFVFRYLCRRFDPKVYKSS